LVAVAGVVVGVGGLILSVPEVREAVFDAADSAIDALLNVFNESEDQSGAQDKRLSNSEIRALQDAGIDPHDEKPNSKYDLFRRPNGDIVVKPKGGGGPGEPTGLNLNDILRTLGR
jgi:hypothetical protein